MNVDRRRFIGSAAGMAATTGVAAHCLWPKHSVSYRRPRSFVAILHALEYSEKIETLLMEGLRLFRFSLLRKTVLLKPNLVEDLPGPVNTNANIIGAVARCFLRLGATRVVIGEGPGHQRDTRAPGAIRQFTGRYSAIYRNYSAIRCQNGRTHI